jgi:uncharacterized protein (DUF111 family)
VLGAGRVRTSHGELPVPAPAVLRLLAEQGAPAGSGGFRHEMTTPTGAALILSICSGWGDLPWIEVRGVGVGAGTRDHPAVANVVRVVLGTGLPRAVVGPVDVRSEHEHVVSEHEHGVKVAMARSMAAAGPARE